MSARSHCNGIRSLATVQPRLLNWCIKQSLYVRSPACSITLLKSLCRGTILQSQAPLNMPVPKTVSCRTLSLQMAWTIPLSSNLTTIKMTAWLLCRCNLYMISGDLESVNSLRKCRTGSTQRSMGASHPQRTFSDRCSSLSRCIRPRPVFRVKPSLWWLSTDTARVGRCTKSFRRCRDNTRIAS
jgi:hypothetical protein